MPINESNPNRLDLDYPFEYQGQRYEYLDVRRPTVEDQLVIAPLMKKDDVRGEIQLFANLSMMAPEAIQKMDMADYNALQEMYKGFFHGKSGKS